ncbi:MAG: hypothetical protein LC734_07250 [Acidobacteria bacterium]|nr:hypothetical protein [Acidobacteriota bacterium]
MGKSAGAMAAIESERATISPPPDEQAAEKPRHVRQKHQKVCHSAAELSLFAPLDFRRAFDQSTHRTPAFRLEFH